MSILSIFKREKRAAEPAYGPAFGYAAMPEFSLSPHAAENLSTVFACVTAVSNAVSALPALLYQNQGKTRSEAISGPFCAIVKNGPNPWQTWPEFVEMLVAQVLLRGNGLVEIESDRSGVVTGLRVIPWDWCVVQMTPQGRLIYDVYDQQGKRRRLLQHEVIHIRDRSDDGIVGKSRLQRAAAVLRNAQAVNSFATAILENGLHVSGVLTSERDLTAEAIAGVRQKFQDTHGGANRAGKLLILPGGNFAFHKVSITPEDAELLESRKFTTEEICRLFQVPPPIVQDYSHNTFTNSEQAGRWFAQFCLLPWVRKIEAAFNRALFAESDFELVLDMSGFDRGSPESRWAAHAIAAGNGILTVDEIRKIEGWGPKVGTVD
jgi:HK97 family phage portal protein